MQEPPTARAPVIGMIPAILKTAMSIPDTPPDQTGQLPPYAPFRPFLHRVLFIVCVVILLWILYQVQRAIMVTFTGLVMAVVLGGLAARLRRILPWKDKAWMHVVSLGIVFLGIMFMLIGFAALIAPDVVRDIQKLEDQIPKAIENVKELPGIRSFIDNDGEGMSSEQVQELSSTITSGIVSVATATISTVTGVVVIIFIALFGAAQPALYRDGVASLFPLNLREKAYGHMDACARALWEWLIGQWLSMVIIAVMVAAALLALGLEYALTLALIAGIFQFVPFLGPIVATVPALFVAMADSPQMVLWVLIAYIIIQSIESNFVTPVVMKHKVNLPPVITLIATVVFGLVFGLLGVIIATPLAVVILVLYHRLYQREILGLETRAPGDPR